MLLSAELRKVRNSVTPIVSTLTVLMKNHAGISLALSKEGSGDRTREGHDSLGNWKTEETES